MLIVNDFNTTVKKALSEIDSNWESYQGVVICGTHTPLIYEVEKQLEIIQNARIIGIPLLGICFGHQLVAIEYARNVLGIKDATSEEFGKGTFVVKKREEGLKVGLINGESYWNNYEVDLPEWKKPDNFITCQFHPEYQSSVDSPHPLLLRFINLCKSESQNR